MFTPPDTQVMAYLNTLFSLMDDLADLHQASAPHQQRARDGQHL